MKWWLYVVIRKGGKDVGETQFIRQQGSVNLKIRTSGVRESSLAKVMQITGYKKLDGVWSARKDHSSDGSDF